MKPVKPSSKLIAHAAVALPAARCDAQYQLLLFEPYLVLGNVVRLMAAGLMTVVAPMGTALTDAQAAALRKLTKNVFLLYDSDKAGLQATFRSGDELLRQGAAVRVVTLPEGEDPDTFVKNHGPAALTARSFGGRPAALPTTRPCRRDPPPSVGAALPLPCRA